MLTNYLYLIVIIVSLAGMAVLDHKYQLALWRNRKMSLMIIGLTVGVFLLWDIVGIVLGVFMSNSDYNIGLYLGHPDLPIEEPLLLSLISYLTLLYTTWREEKS